MVVSAESATVLAIGLAEKVRAMAAGLAVLAIEMCQG